MRFRRAVTGRRRGLPVARTSAKVRPSKKTRGTWGESVMSESTTIIGGPVLPYVRKVMAVCALKGGSLSHRPDHSFPAQ